MTLPKGASPTASNSASIPLELVLASESPRREALLLQAGITPDAIRPARIDENPRRAELPRAYALRMAQEKARAVSGTWTGAPALILAADTVVALGRRILPKAETDAQVRACLTLLGGRSHQVLTAVALANPQRRVLFRSVATRVSFARLATNMIDEYVASGEGLGKAGGYAIQGKAEAFVRRINGSYSNIVGLPLFETVKGAGYSVQC
jgi:septum formation protein